VTNNSSVTNKTMPDAALLGRVLAVSPHLDDALLSAGGLLAACPGAVVLTVLAGFPEPGLALTDWDRASGFAEGDDVVAARRAEDRRAVEAVGAHPVWLDFLDGQYDASRPAVDDIADAIRSAARDYDANTIAFPLALGHPDHELVHRACVALLTSDYELVEHWLAWTDSPYRTNAFGIDLIERRLASLRDARFETDEWELEVDGRKSAAVGAYSTQLKALYAESSQENVDGDVMSPERFYPINRTSEAASDGSLMVPITTPNGDFHVWTKRVGTNNDLKVLLLHGGPGATDELYECFDDWFPDVGIEYYYYDQLGSLRSDQPDDPSLWNLARFVDEVEQVRQALGLGSSNFVLLGQSWGGILAMEYAVHHQEHLKGLVISNMMSSARLYNAYATDVLMPTMDQDVLAEIKRFEAEHTTDDPRYEQLLMEHHYVLHVCRIPLDEWPDAVRRTFAHINPAIYVPMQGPSELGLSGTLEDWDRSDDLRGIEVPTLVIGAAHDTMDPAHMRWMSEQLPRGTYLHCPDGSHLSQFDDPQHYFPGLISFLQSL
jgi:proline iminopeptidase